MSPTSAWARLLSTRRRKQSATAVAERPANNEETRTEIERDHDRILFSTPVRRLADKTQVFPLDKNDSVRTRLTHSHEVSNLARSIGTTLAFKHGLAAELPNAKRDIPAVLAAVGLAHDLGNPPFGHQGEASIQSWFRQHSDAVLFCLGSEQHKQDFLKFEGNAQSFRLLTRLQLLNDGYGLDLTCASLAGLMKYPTGSHQTASGSVASKKHGFFASEQGVAEMVLAETGLSLGRRHPAAYIMEACDDIAYVVMDVEDAVKKRLASYQDVIAYLKHSSNGDELIDAVVADSDAKHDKYRESYSLSPSELNDVSMQRFRVAAIGAMVRAATDAFVAALPEFEVGTSELGLMARSKGKKLRALLKNFGLRNAYTHRSVQKIELEGHNAILSLMDMFWAAIRDRATEENVGSERRHPFATFVYGRISENYRRVFEDPPSDCKGLSIRYRECQLVTDMLSGMTDTFAMDLCAELMALKADYDVARFLATR